MRKEKLTPVGMLIILSSILAFISSSGEFGISLFVVSAVTASLLVKGRFSLSGRGRNILIFSILLLVALKVLVLKMSLKGFIPWVSDLGPAIELCMLVFVYKKEERRDSMILFSLSGALFIIAGNTGENRAYLPLLSIFSSLSLVLFLNSGPLKTSEFRLSQWAPVLLSFISAVGFCAVLIYLLNWIEPFRASAMYRISMRGLDFSRLSNVTYIGYEEEYFLSKKVVMRIFSPVCPERIRARVYSHYSSGNWRGETFPVFEIAKEAHITGNAEIDSYVPHSHHYSYILCSRDNLPRYLHDQPIRQTIVLESRAGRILFLPDGTFLFNTGMEHPLCDRYGILFRGLVTRPSEYVALGERGRPGGLVSRDIVARYYKGEAVGDEEALAKCRELPEKLSAEFRGLAMEITRDCRSDWEKAVAIRDYFHHNFTYRLGYAPLKGRDPVEDFVLNVQAAHCEYFASGMALLLRASGVPARYVVGFAVHEYNRRGGYYIVREKDAHAWCEAYIPHRGWFAFDPTPPSIIEGGTGDRFEAMDELNLFMTRLTMYILQGNLKQLVGFAWSSLVSLVRWLFHDLPHTFMTIVIVLAVIISSLVRSRGHSFFLPGKKPGGRPRLPHLQRLAGILEKLEKVLKAKGIPRLPSLTPREYITRMKEHRFSAPHMEIASEIIDDYYHLRYGGQIPREDQFHSLEEKITKFRELR